MKIGIIGAGYVGEATGKLMKELGNDVLFYDIEPKPKLSGSFAVLNDLEKVVKQSELLFICVPTPQKESGEIDLSIIKSVCEELVKIFIEQGKSIPVVIKSTVVPGTTSNIIKPILERSGFEISVGCNPEFITESHTSWSEEEGMKRDWSNEDKIVIGSEDASMRNMINKIYSGFEEKIINTDTKTAEMIKYASNVCLASRISFFNEMFEICKELGIDNELLTKSLSMDSRIGKYGTINGKAYGGKCLPKDTKALRYFLKDKLKSPMVDATVEINNKMKEKYGVRE